MKPTDAAIWAQLAELFDELSELDAPTRALELQELRTRNPDIATRVEAMLIADAEQGGPLEHSLDDIAPALQERLGNAGWETQTGDVIGRYRLLDAIGSGGMGEVWRAERADGEFEHDVALKLLKRGMDTQAILSRFLQERSILARLQHPGIVRLLDGGMSDDGRPYFVMEHVSGCTVTEHAERAGLDARARVALVVAIADAVSYAHSQLVIHRDLKPSNVIVDAQGKPHLLDFGIAKMLEDSSEQTLTGTGVRVFSPAYAAPEQILGEAAGTAIDVYSLGVLLFELLTGQTPHRRASRDPLLLAAELERETTERVSQALARSSADSAVGHDRRRMLRDVSGDLDLIVATAMQRDPRRRYATMAAFADDLRRWLDGRPITARADSRRYRVGRFVRRHRVGVAASVFVALALVGGLGVALWQADIARNEARRADGERELARQQLARAERVKDFVLALFREQDSTSRASVLARTPPELIREGIAQVDATLAGEPALQADLLRDLGEIQTSLGEREAGKATLQRAWEMHKAISGERSAAAAEALAAYAIATMVAGDMVAAEPMLREAIATRVAISGPEYPKAAQDKATLARMALIAARDEEALQLAQEARRMVIATSGPDSAQLSPILHLVSIIESQQSRYDDALATAREALRIVEATSGADHVRTITLHSQISDVLRNQRSFSESLTHLDSALRIARANLPPRHPTLGAILTRQGDQLRRMGRYDEAEEAFTEAVGLLAGTRSGELAQIMQNYGTLAVAQGRADVAVERYRESVALFRQASGESTYTLLSTLLLADAMAVAGSLEEAGKTADEATVALARITDADSYESAFAATVVGRMRYRQGRFAEAVPLHRKALAHLAPTYGEEHVETAEARTMLARSLVTSSDPAARAEAAALIERALPVIEAVDNKRSLLGEIYLVRAQLRIDANDAAGARADVERAERAFAKDASDRVSQRQRARLLRERIVKAVAAPSLPGRSRN